METIVEARNEVAEHMARTRKSVKQQQLRGLRRARLPIEDMETINVGRVVPDGGHGDAPQRFSPTAGPASLPSAQCPHPARDGPPDLVWRILLDVMAPRDRH